MFVPARRLVERLRQPRERRTELRRLERRLSAAPTAAAVTDEELRLALKLRELRAALVDALGAVDACRSCAEGHPLPFGRWSGGHCCGSRTEVLFSDDELAALKLAGTTRADLDPPRSELAGCVFRGPTGCSLDPRDRPNLCVRFLCRELEREVASRPDKRHIRAIQAELTACFSRFAELRARGREAARAPWEP